MSASIKDHVKFAASVAVVIIIITYVQKNHVKVPLVGQYLPGGA
jgi:hypothetical protein